MNARDWRDQITVFTKIRTLSYRGARPVGICEIELIGEPHEKQNRASSGSCAEQEGHRTRSI